MISTTQNRHPEPHLGTSDVQQTADDPENSSAARPADRSLYYNLALYNIGSDVTATPGDVATEICNIIYDKCIDAIIISSLFSAKNERMPQLQAIVGEVLSKLSNDDGRPANSVDRSASQPAWKSQMKGYYVCVWNTQRLTLTAYKDSQKDLSGISQHLQFRQAQQPRGPLLHFHHHCDAARAAPPVVVSVRPG